VTVDDALRAVADPTRRAILRLVRDDELPAGQIAAQFPEMSRPAVSQHLRVLVDAGLVDVRAAGNRRLYRWRPEGLQDAAAFIEDMWADRLTRLRHHDIPAALTAEHGVGWARHLADLAGLLA
jgi:DNA-binding transcriptional ArsR family regulator